MKILAIGDFHGKFPEKLKKIARGKDIDLILSIGDYAGIDDFRPYLRKTFKAREKGKNVWLEDIAGKKKYRKLLKKDYAAGKIILKELNKLGIKTFSVFGNGDWYRCFYNKTNRDYILFIKKLKFIKDINRSKASFKKLRIVGFGGYLDPDIYFTKKGKKAIADNESINKKRKKRYSREGESLMRLMKYKPNILLIHYTPYKCLDTLGEKGYMLTGSNMGVSFYNKAIKKYKPALVICGHMHENQGKCKIGKTFVINTGAAGEGKAALIDFDEEKKRVKGVRFIQ